MSTDRLGDMTAACAPGSQPQPALVELEVCGLNGEELVRTKLPAVCTGKEVRKMVAEKLPYRPGAKFLLYHGNSQVMLDRTLREQGIVGQRAMLSYTLCPTDLCAAWSFVKGTARQEDPLALEGLTCIEGATTSDYLRHLPKTLQTLTFGDTFNQNLKGMTFPSNLQSLKFGDNFNQKLGAVSFPSTLQSLTFGSKFTQNLEDVILSDSLRILVVQVLTVSCL